MSEKIANLLIVGGHANSLGKVDEVIDLVLNDESRIEELYACLFDADAWVRMRAADALEKICRVHPGWLLPYIDRFSTDLTTNSQPSIQWHLAQIYRQVNLNDKQRRLAIDWLKHLLSTIETDWIVAANAMDTLAQFTTAGFFSKEEMISLLIVQQQHKSKSVVRRADKLLDKLSVN